MSIKKTLHSLACLFVFGVFMFLGSALVTPEHEARAALSKRVFLTSGTSWTVPADWSDVNTIDTIGGGGTGGTNSGGGGGAYAKIVDLDLTAGNSVSYQIGTAGSDTVFNSSATTCAGSPTPSVCADGGVIGVSSTDGTGGTTANSIGTTEYAGGNGGGGSGGGAAGPRGAGTAGTIDDAGTGGAGFGGSGGIGGIYESEPPAFCAAPGGNGSPGTEFSTTPAYGSGGGGGYGPVTCNAGVGGSFGGGGGGSPAKAGGDGLIVITYTSTETGSTSLAKFKIKGGSFLIRGGRVQIR